MQFKAHAKHICLRSTCKTCDVDGNACKARVADKNPCNACVDDGSTCEACVDDRSVCEARVVEESACRAHVVDKSMCKACVVDKCACKAHVVDKGTCKARVVDEGPNKECVVARSACKSRIVVEAHVSGRVKHTCICYLPRRGGRGLVVGGLGGEDWLKIPLSLIFLALTYPARIVLVYLYGMGVVRLGCIGLTEVMKGIGTNGMLLGGVRV